MRHLQHLDDITTTATELAKLLDCSTQYLAQLRKEKVIDWVAPSRFVLTDTSRPHQRSGVKYGGSATAQALKEEQLRRLRLANDERERRTIKLDEAQLALDVLCGTVRSAFGAAPAKLAQDFAGQQRAEAVVSACLAATADAVGRLVDALREGQDPEVAIRGVLNAAWSGGGGVPGANGSTAP